MLREFDPSRAQLATAKVESMTDGGCVTSGRWTPST
jgi:hypothetical protein